MRISTRGIALGGLGISTVALALVLGGIALSAPGEGGKIDGCYDESNGILSVLGAKKTVCDPDTELPISWNVQGPQGPQGPQGLPPAPAELAAGDIATRRLSRAQRRAARLPIAPLRRGAFRRRRGPAAGNAPPLAVGVGGIRILKAHVGSGRIDPETGVNTAPVYGRGPDYAVRASVAQTYNASVGAQVWSFGIVPANGLGYVDVFFRIDVDSCVPVSTNSWIAEVVGNRVRVGVSSSYEYTAGFNMVVICDPRDEVPTEVPVAQPVPR